MTSKNKNAPQGHHGQTAVPDRGRKLGTKVQSTPMAGPESGNRFAYKRSNVWDSVNAKKDPLDRR